MLLKAGYELPRRHARPACLVAGLANRTRGACRPSIDPVVGPSPVSPSTLIGVGLSSPDTVTATGASPSSPEDRPESAEQPQQSAGVHRLDQVEVDARLRRAAAFRFLPLPGDGDEQGPLAPAALRSSSPPRTRPSPAGRCRAAPRPAGHSWAAPGRRGRPGRPDLVPAQAQQQRRLSAVSSWSSTTRTCSPFGRPRTGPRPAPASGRAVQHRVRGSCGSPPLRPTRQEVV